RPPSAAAQRWRVWKRQHPPRVPPASRRSVSAPSKRPRKVPYWPIFDRENDVYGLRDEPPALYILDHQKRRFRRFLDMLNVVSSKARGEASMSAKNGSIKLIAGNSNPALA